MSEGLHTVECSHFLSFAEAYHSFIPSTGISQAKPPLTFCNLRCMIALCLKSVLAKPYEKSFLSLFLFRGRKRDPICKFILPRDCDSQG